MYLKPKIRVVCTEFLTFKYVFIRWLFIFLQQKSWKLSFKTSYLVHNIHLYLCGHEENTKWILCSREIGVKYAYLRFLTKSINCNCIFFTQIWFYFKCLLICHTISESDLFLYIYHKSLIQRLKPIFFFYKNIFWICVLVL